MVIEWAASGPILNTAFMNYPGRNDMSPPSPDLTRGDQVAPRSQSSEKPEGEAMKAGDSQCADILIVDNDERIVELLAWFLSKRGYSVQSAHSFAEAREVLAAGLPDLMLSDLDLGVESALVELPALAKQGLLPPTLVVSGYLNAETTQRLTIMDQVLGVLAKPFDFASLEDRIVSCLEDLALSRAAETLPSAPSQASAPVTEEEEWVEIQPHPRPAIQPSPSRSGLSPSGLATSTSPAAPQSAPGVHPSVDSQSSAVR